jgi:diketogulonate reductase-like aldo/keto reductase
VCTEGDISPISLRGDQLPHPAAAVMTLIDTSENYGDGRTERFIGRMNRFRELDVLPGCEQHNMPVMAYSPLGGDDHLVVGDRTLAEVGAMRGCSGATVALTFVIRSRNVIAIPESGNPVHVKENAVALSIRWLPACP